jgi:uncharacterized protein YjbI with pentapeptide repeats
MENLPNHSRLLQIVTAMFQLVAFAATAHGDIFQWEYINPADPGQGKRQSTTLAPGGTGVDAIPGAGLIRRNLTMAYLIGADLTGANAHHANLTDADLSQGNLRNANLTAATLTDADFTGAEIRGASFNHDFANFGGIGISLEQLYSTASYQLHDLSGTRFWQNQFFEGNFAGQNLTNADFFRAWLTDADFTDAEVRGANFNSTEIMPAQLYSTASYQARDLSGIGLGSNNLTGANFVAQNLTNASFWGATLSDADFTGAEVRGASFNITVYDRNYLRREGTGLTLSQLYSTTSYQSKDLSGISLRWNHLVGGNFEGQNLNEANFGQANLTGASFHQANLTNANFANYTCGWDGCPQISPGADFTEADVRGAFLLLSMNDNTTNSILPDGHIRGLDLATGGLLIVRDYDGDPYRVNPRGVIIEPLPPIPVKIDQNFSIAPGGTLRIVFESDAWDSTISFAPGIPVTLGGTLELVFAEDVNLASQVGRTFDLFDWTGVNPAGAFAISTHYGWNLSNLYTTGEVTLTAVPEINTMALAVVVASGLTMYRRRKIA